MVNEPDILMDLETPSKVRRSPSLRALGAHVMQDTNAFAKDEPDARRLPLHFPVRVQVGLLHLSPPCCPLYACNHD
jgi:hypothetical protein